MTLRLMWVVGVLSLGISVALAQNPKESALLEVEKRIGQNAEKVMNRTQTFTLYKKVKVNESNEIPVLFFVIVRNDDQRIVEEGSVTMGAIEWTADYELEISQTTGQAQLPRNENSNPRKIDLRKYLAREVKKKD